jgi:hypothetical protein
MDSGITTCPFEESFVVATVIGYLPVILLVRIHLKTGYFNNLFACPMRVPIVDNGPTEGRFPYGTCTHKSWASAY